MGIRNFMKQSSDIHKKGEDWFEPVLNIHKSISFTNPIFYLSLFNSVAKKLLLEKYLEGGVCPSPLPFQVTPMIVRKL
jgi:hypothetical protein